MDDTTILPFFTIVPRTHIYYNNNKNSAQQEIYHPGKVLKLNKNGSDMSSLN